jgi:hypothetical protein
MTTRPSGNRLPPENPPGQSTTFEKVSATGSKSPTFETDKGTNMTFPVGSNTPPENPADPGTSDKVAKSALRTPTFCEAPGTNTTFPDGTASTPPVKPPGVAGGPRLHPRVTGSNIPTLGAVFGTKITFPFGVRTAPEYPGIAATFVKPKVTGSKTPRLEDKGPGTHTTRPVGARTPPSKPEAPVSTLDQRRLWGFHIPTLASPLGTNTTFPEGTATAPENLLEPLGNPSGTIAENVLKAGE